MAGIDNDVFFAKNSDFSGSATHPESNGLFTNGQIWIGTTAVNAGGTHVNVGTITSTGNTVTITYDSPNINLEVAGGSPVQSITGGPGITITGTADDPIVNSVIFTDQGSSTTIDSDNGYFVTGNFNMTLPASPAQGELVIVYADTTSAVTVTANTGQVIRIGSAVSATAGNAVSTARGDSLTFRFRTSGSQWCCVSVMGNWILT